MQKLYYFFPSDNGIPPIFEAELVQQNDHVLLIMHNKQETLLYKKGIKYSTNKKEIEELWRDNCLEIITNLEGELLDLQERYSEGAKFQ
jgi:hypothetical protein